MPSIDAYLTKEDQLCAAIKAVREVLPLPKKVIMAKQGCHDLAGELACASILLPAIGRMNVNVHHDLDDLLKQALSGAMEMIKRLGTEYAHLKGLELSLAIANLAASALK